MNKLIKLQQDTSVGSQWVEIDTSTEYKTFQITEHNGDGNQLEALDIQLQMNEEELVIGNVQLNKLGIKLLKEFINQLNTEI